MPIRGDRLRWPPRPGKKSSGGAAHTGTRSRSSSEQQTPQPPLRQPNEQDESADRHSGGPRQVIEQARQDVESGKEDTDCRNRGPTK